MTADSTSTYFPQLLPVYELHPVILIKQPLPWPSSVQRALEWSEDPRWPLSDTVMSGVFWSWEIWECRCWRFVESLLPTAALLRRANSSKTLSFSAQWAKVAVHVAICTVPKSNSLENLEHGFYDRELPLMKWYFCISCYWLWWAVPPNFIRFGPLLGNKL